MKSFSQTNRAKSLPMVFGLVLTSAVFFFLAPAAYADVTFKISAFDDIIYPHSSAFRLDIMQWQVQDQSGYYTGVWSGNVSDGQQVSVPSSGADLYVVQGAHWFKMDDVLVEDTGSGSPGQFFLPSQSLTVYFGVYNVAESNITNGSYIFGSAQKDGQTNCPANSFMAGLNRVTDDDWNLTQVVCRNYNPSQLSVSGSPYVSGGMDQSGRTDCPAGSFIVGLNRRSSSDDEYKQIVCQNYNASQVHLSGSPYLFGGMLRGYSSKNQSRTDCPADSFMVGLNRRSSSEDESTQVVCQNYSVVAPPQPPSNLSAACPSPGAAANLSWSASPGATRYELRVDNRSNGWNGDCSVPNAGDICRNDITQTSYSFSSVPGADYRWWLHAANPSGSSAPTHGPDFICSAVGSVRFNATKDGEDWDAPPFTVNYTGPSGTFTVSIDSPVDIPNLSVGAYTINAVTPPAGVTLQNVNGSSLPYTQTLSAGGVITFTFNFITIPVSTGTLQIRATKDGQPWDSPPFAVNYTGPSGTVTASFHSPNDIAVSAGVYAINSVTPPAGVTYSGVAPSVLQTLSPGGVITFTFNFATVVTSTPVPTLAIAPSSASVNVGSAQQFNAIYDPDGSGAQSPFSVTNSSNWSSSNASVATVDSVGSAIGVSAGSATVAANYSGLTASAVLTVTASGSVPGGGGVTIPLSVSCSASPTSTIIGQSAVWTAAASGGAGLYAYSWSGSSPLEGKTDNPANVSYATTGVKTGSVTVVSGGSSAANSCANSVSVIATDQPPTASNLNVSISQGGVESLTDNCKVISDVSFFWIYSDQDGDSQSAVRIQIDNNGDFSSPEFDSNKINHSNPLYALPVGSLGVGTYYWRLKLWDSQNKESGWFNGSSSFTISSVQAVDFSWTPNLPFVDQTISFVSSSIIPVSSHSWIFQNGSPAASASANPQSKFLAVGVKQVKLSVISGTKSCSVSKNVVVGGGGPL